MRGVSLRQFAVRAGERSERAPLEPGPPEMVSHDVAGNGGQEGLIPAARIVGASSGRPERTNESLVDEVFEVWAGARTIADATSAQLATQKASQCRGVEAIDLLERSRFTALEGF
jgi:hypothetical protein